MRRFNAPLPPFLPQQTQPCDMSTRVYHNFYHNVNMSVHYKRHDNGEEGTGGCKRAWTSNMRASGARDMVSSPQVCFFIYFLTFFTYFILFCFYSYISGLNMQRWALDLNDGRRSEPWATTCHITTFTLLATCHVTLMPHQHVHFDALTLCHITTTTFPAVVATAEAGGARDMSCIGPWYVFFHYYY